MVRISVFMGEKLVRTIDRSAAKEGRNRSAFLRHIAEEYFALEEVRKRRRRAMEKATGIKDAIRFQTKPWNAVAFIRKMRTVSH